MNSTKVFIYSIFIIIALIFLGWYMAIPYQNPEIITVTVQEKYVKKSKGLGKYMIIDTNNNTYEITDLIFKSKFNSSDLYAELKEGQTYEIEVTGSRIKWLSCYKNINIIREIQ